MELATGRPALWATVQFVASASLGDPIESHVELLARGKRQWTLRRRLQLRALPPLRITVDAVDALHQHHYS